MVYYGRTSVSLNPGENQGEILLTLGSNTELRDWLGENTQENKLVNVVKARVIGKDGLAVDVPLYADSPIFMTQLRGTFEAPVNLSGVGRK
ncbi:MAG: hypothetical protein GX207_00940 [Peptococcaceae bacterium]|nr:hypothetical protein [Peptococcaceae bacterium]